MLSPSVSYDLCSRQAEKSQLTLGRFWGVFFNGIAQRILRFVLTSS